VNPSGILVGLSEGGLNFCNTEHRGGVVKTPALYSGGSSLKSRSGNRLSWQRVFVFFLRISRQMLLFKLGHDLPSTHFPIHHSRITPSFNAIFCHWRSVVK